MRKARVKAGRDATVDQSVGKATGKEAVTVEKKGIVRGIFDDKAKLAIVAMAFVMISEIVLYGVLALTTPSVPTFFESLLMATLVALGSVCGAQQLNGKIARSK